MRAARKSDRLHSPQLSRVVAQNPRRTKTDRNLAALDGPRLTESAAIPRWAVQSGHAIVSLVRSSHRRTRNLGDLRRSRCFFQPKSVNKENRSAKIGRAHV